MTAVAAPAGEFTGARVGYDPDIGAGHPAVLPAGLEHEGAAAQAHYALMQLGAELEVRAPANCVSS